MKTLIIGAPGVGKTTVLKKAKDKLKNYETINFGTEMLKTAKKKNLAKNRDELRKIPKEKNKKIQKKTAKKIKKKKKTLIDTHLAIETPKGILPGMPKWVLKELNPDSIILIEAKPEELEKRRKKDKSRKRDDFKTQPTLHQELNRAYATTASTETGALIKIINNEEGKVDKAAEELVKTLEEK